MERNGQEAVRLFRLAAEQGASYAQAALGQIYEFGQGVPVDRRKKRSRGIGELQTQARPRISRADWEKSFSLGQGVDKNIDEAVKFLTLAADKRKCACSTGSC